MAGNLTLKERTTLLKDLEQVFDSRTADVLLGVVEQVALQVPKEGVTREDFRELKQAVTELAAAQARTEEAVKTLAEKQARTDEAVKVLAEKQARTEEAVKALAEAQARTEERVSKLESAVERLTEAQARTDESVKALAAAQARTEKALQELARQVGGLSDTVGGDIEDIAYISPYEVIATHDKISDQI